MQACLLWAVVQRPYDKRTADHLQTAMLSDLKYLYVQQASASTARLSRSEQIFQRFLDALGREQQLPPRDGADALCIPIGILHASIKGTDRVKYF